MSNTPADLVVFEKGEKALAAHRDTLLYNVKIKNIRGENAFKEYYVHYLGWKSR